MTGNHFSIILLSTLKCNADCDYCFENKTSDRLTIDRLGMMMEKVLDYMEEKETTALTIHWQGGEAMLLSPAWYEQAYARIGQMADARNKQVFHGLQTNMLLYRERWNPVIAGMFENSVSTSVDFPNLHRKVLGRGPDDYNDIWYRKVRQARDAGIDVKVISVPNQGTLEIGAERFYSHFVDELDITDFQINTPFPGGDANADTAGMPLDVDQLTRFYLELADLWLEHGYDRGVKIGPFDELLKSFSHEEACLPCIWADNCANHILAIDARGYVAQCDCWVTSYPEYFFGNIFECDSFSELLQNSKARRDFQARPITLMQRDCIECDYLSLCHGGCPVRTYTVGGSLFEKDPYCHLYKSLFKHMEEAAAQRARQTVTRRSVACACAQ